MSKQARREIKMARRARKKMFTSKRYGGWMNGLKGEKTGTSMQKK